MILIKKSFLLNTHYKIWLQNEPTQEHHNTYMVGVVKHALADKVFKSVIIAEEWARRHIMRIKHDG